MNEREAKELVKKTFENRFDREQFGVFTEDLLKRHSLLEDSAIYDDEKAFSLSGNYVRHAFKEYIGKYERVGQFTDVDGEKIDVLVVYLNKETTLERGRKTLRSFAEDYLKSERGRDKSAVLAANVSPDESDWRFSFVKLDIKRQRDDSGKVKDVIDYRVPAKRFSFLVGENEYSHTAQKQFAELLKSQSSPTLEQIEKAFDIERVTKDFYQEYEKLFERVRDEIESLRADSKLDRHFEERCIKNDDFTKKLLGQILFLYFLQKKGWFGLKKNQKWGEGRKDYLRFLFTRHKENYQTLKTGKRHAPNFFNDVLAHLFYDALNIDRRDNDDYYSHLQSRIPFLNGGLFEPSYKWRDFPVYLPDELFSNEVKTKDDETGTGILDIFDRYNFTVHESEPLETEVAIDPEMLGNVFENLLLKEERGRSGTFYTPRLIVNYMCRQSLLDYLTTKLLPKGEQTTTDKTPLTVDDLENFIAFAEEYAAFEVRKKEGDEEKEYVTYRERQFPAGIKEYAAKIDAHLATVKVCDPAIGSGAFPVGILQEIVRLRKSLITTGKVKKRSEYELKLHTIQNSIYGVDLSQSAVDIARLRLWLSLIVDEKDRDEIEVLPNLDYKIVQGNSLIDEFEGEKLLPDDFIKRNTPKTFAAVENKETLRNRLQTEYFEEVGKGGKNSIKAQQIFREVEDLSEQIRKDKSKGKSDTKQSDLLTADEDKARQRLKELHQKHGDIFKTKNSNEKNALRRSVDLKILEFIQENLDEKECRVNAEITNTEAKLDAEVENTKQTLKKAVETPKIVRLRKTLDALNNRLTHLEKVRYDLRNLWQNKPNDDTDDLTDIDRENFTPFKTKPFFLWETQFLEIFFDEEGKPLENPGFDIVIANPPYVRSGKIEKAHKEAFSRNFDTFDGNADIYVYFYEKGLDVLHDKGTLTFITSNSFLNSGFGEKLRVHLKGETQIKEIVDFAETSVFDATVETNIIHLAKPFFDNSKIRILKWNETEPLESLPAKIKTDSFFIQQSKLKDESWQLEEPKILNLLEKLKTCGTPLDKYVNGEFYYGIKTGLNEAFVVDKATKEKLIAEHESSAEVLKPFLRGRDVKRWRTEPQDLWLIFTRRGIDIENYPAIKNHLHQFKEKLIPGIKGGRKAGSYKWFEIQDNIAYWQEFKKPKIVYQDIARYFGVAWDDSGAMLANTCYFIPTDEKFLLGVLLSSSIRFWVEKVIGSDEGGFIRLFSIHVGKFPIPDAEDWQKEIIEKFVDYILFLTKADGEKLIVNYFESIINALVYELFLTDELHLANKRFLAPLKTEKLPALSAHKGSELQAIRELFARLSDINHVVRSSIYFLDNIESVRIIEGKQ